MKRFFSMLLFFAIMLALLGCSGDFVVKDNGNRYLLLPGSGVKVRLDEDDLKLTRDIDEELLKAAESKIYENLSEYTDTPEFFVFGLEGELYLGAEEIVEYDPPHTSDDGAEAGCGIDHDHKYFEYQITK